MFLEKTWQKLNILKQCREYNLSIWQCPSFLFFLIGFITILAMVSTYFVAVEYTQPEIVALIVIFVTIFLMVVGYLVTKGFENLAQANRLKTEFVSIASHQLRTPLTGIKWTIDLILRDKDLNDKNLERIEDIKYNNNRLIKLVNDLLDVSRVEQKRLSLKPEKVFLEEITQKLIEEYQTLAKASNVKLVLEQESELSPLIMDSQGVELVLRNLLDNAIRYTQGGGVVKVKLSQKDNKIRCEIKDQGVGIPKGDQKNIFKKFFRSENVMKYQTVGTGLGLFIAQAVIEESKGEIGFWSQENKGTTFWFELPIKN